jgi:hypothetical protein
MPRLLPTLKSFWPNRAEHRCPADNPVGAGPRHPSGAFAASPFAAQRFHVDWRPSADEFLIQNAKVAVEVRLRFRSTSDL